MSGITKTTTPPRRRLPQPYVVVDRSERQSALLAIVAMLVAVLLFNLAAYTLNAITTSLMSTTKAAADNCESLLHQQQQDWLVAAPATTKLCFMSNIMLGVMSGVLLVTAFLWWITVVSDISASVRNYALGCGIGAGIVGIVLVHILLIKRLIDGGGLLMAINTIMGLALTGLAFGTIE